MNTDKIYAESIAKEYAPRNDSKVVALRKLDHAAKRPALITAGVIGGVATLLLGVGMCLALGAIGSGTAVSMGAGVVLGLAGIVLGGVNYPIYERLLARGKAQYAGDIMRLAREISGEA